MKAWLCVVSWLFVAPPPWLAGTCPEQTVPSTELRACVAAGLDRQVRACARDRFDPGCMKVARAEPEATAAWMRRGCEAEDAGSCAFLGYMALKGLWRARASVEARASFERACDLGSARSCEALGGLLMTGKLGEKAPKDAMKMFRRGCALGRAPTCFIAGKYLALGEDVSKDVPGARALHVRGCALGYEPSCARARP